MLPEHYTSPRWLLCGPKETLLLLFVNNFEHFHGWRKATWDFRQLFCFSGGFWESTGGMQRAAKDEGWVASLSKSKSGAGGQNSQETTNQGFFQQARKFLAEVLRNQQCTSKKVSEVWKCVFILVWNKNQTFQTPKCFLLLLLMMLLLPLKHLFSEWEDQGSHLDPSPLINWPQKLWKLSHGNIISGTISLWDILVWMKQHFPATMTTNLIKIFEFLQSQ